MKTHQFVTTILNTYLIEFKNTFGDKSSITSTWIGGIEYTRRRQTSLNYAIFDDWRKELFDLMGEKLNINKFYHHLRELYNIVGTLTIRYPGTYKKANSIMWKLLSELDKRFKLHKRKKEISYFKSTIRRIKKVRIEVQPEPEGIEVQPEPEGIEVQPEPEEGEIIIPNPVKNPPKSEEKPKKSPFVIKIKKRPFILIILITLIILIFWLAFSNVTEQVIEKKLAVKTEYYNETISNEISFKEYLENISEIEGENIQLKGFLKRYIEGTEIAGIYVESITDDYNNTINLINMDYDYIKLFPKKGTTQEVYQIEGIFKRKYKTLLLEPTKIELSERGPSGVVLKERRVEYTKETIKNITKPKHPFIRLFVFNLIGKEVICSDGTKLNECSMDKPYFCSMSGLVRNPTKCDCPKGERLYKEDCIEKIECEDGTLHPDCSATEKKQCFEGKLIINAIKCGCPSNYLKRGNECLPTCDDGTVYDECSSEEPFLCKDGELIEKSSKCGCPSDEVPYGDSCQSKYIIDPRNMTFSYILRGKKGSIDFVVYKGMKDYLYSQHSSSYVCNPECPTDREIELNFLDNPQQQKLLLPLVEKIEEKTSNKDDQARIAINLVQQIPYAWLTVSLTQKYPYDVIYDNEGVCGEKSKLMVFILRELGYGVALFTFEEEEHQAVGIKCSDTYDYLNSGYCFIEAAAALMITESNADYVGAGKLDSTPKIIKIADGNSFDSVKEEYDDAKEWHRINAIPGPVIPQYEYDKWKNLVDKYGIVTAE